jgi:predicted dehydrogenase
MQVWGPEGFAGIDFARRHLTLMQPAEHLRQGRLDPAALATLKNDLFGRHVQVQEVACAGGDQLTRELQDFLACVRTGRRPRADGRAGLDAVALAGRVLDSLRAHSWDGSAPGRAGPSHLPAPHGPLFLPPRQEAA